MSANLNIRDGQFVNKRGQLVRLEFGNLEQIALLKKLNEVCAAVRYGTYTARWSELLDVENRARVQFMCTCGRYLSYTGSDDRDFDKHPQILTCFCKKGWKLTASPRSEWELCINPIKSNP